MEQLSAARDELVDTVAKIPLISRAKAESFVLTFEETVADAAQTRVLPFVIGAAALGALSFLFAFTRCRCDSRGGQ